VTGPVHPSGPAARFRVRAEGPPGDAHRYLAIVAYDGGAYSGWQIQPQRPSVQGELERVIGEITGHRPRVHSSGRTDTGVHARAQPAHFDLPFHADAGKLQAGLNALLPSDIRVMRVRAVAPDFHARYSCTGKEYRYFIWNGPVLPPFERRYRTWERRPLDVTAMSEAASRLVGRHDFAPFSANPNREIDGTVRHLRKLDVLRRGALVTIVAQADGFLYRMVRSLAGFLIRVGRGELSPQAAGEILAHGIRTARVPTAPPEGLFLWRVFYR
jgi:tRNA pseudouridine38-40 synthase